MFNSSARWAHRATVAISLIIGAGVWEIAGQHTSAAFMAPLSATLARLLEMVETGLLVRQVASSLSLFFTGFGLAILIGMPLGLLLARVRPLRVALESYIMILYATPTVALVPFILSLLGFGFWPKVLVVFLFAIFPILYNTVEGARSIKPELIEVAHSFRSGEWALWRDIMIPFTLPFTMTGIRQAIGRGLVGMVVAEFFLSSSGLGQLIMNSSQNFDTAGMFAAILIIILLGVMLMDLGRALENKFAAWRGYNR
ncbi:MAG TPA: ABC transporter permease [Acidiferrobacterales bacterium]|nr:ABC transporter permease [Acidiferrobacterales bacterium]